DLILDQTIEKRKQKREKECGVTATFDSNRTTFTREGSFRVTTATEAAEREEAMRQLQDRKAEGDVKSSIPLSSGPSGGVVNQAVAPLPGPPSPSSSPPLGMGGTLGPQVIPRRHAPVEALARQGSFRGFPALNNNSSPFKRQLSLRINELPSTLQRNSDFPMKNTGQSEFPMKNTGQSEFPMKNTGQSEFPMKNTGQSEFPMKNTVPEVEGEGDSISSLCTQITSAFSGPPEDPFSQAPMPRPASSPQSPVAPPGAQPDTNPWAKTPGHAGHHSPLTSSSARPGGDWTTPVIVAPPSATSSPSHHSHRRTPSEADRWLEEVTKSVRAPQPGSTPPSQPFLTPNPPAFSTAPTQAFIVPMPSTQAFPATLPPNQPFSTPPTQAFSVPTPPTQAFAVPTPPTQAVAPVAFMSSLSPVMPMLPPRQLAYHAQTPASYPMSNGLPYAHPSVPMVGITPSQMVANVFGSATQPQAYPTPRYDPAQHAVCIPFSNPHQQPLHFQAPNGSVAFNGGGADSWAPPSLPPPSSPAPPLPPQPSPAPPLPPQPLATADPFEAKWAALESRSRQHTTPSPTNPFSSELHKTFEIQL
ncbi:unnamed protein product, partial [Coregonus sp. 'balchen']